MKAQDQSITNATRKTLRSVIVQGVLNFLIGVIVIGAVLSLIAWTFDYWQAWVFAILFNLGTASQGIYLFIKDPELLERRKQVAPEDESTTERFLIIFGLLSLICLIIFSAIDYRFGWSYISVFVTLVGDSLIILSFIFYYFVFMENSFAASSIRTFEGQSVISTGLYAIIRHPKYVGDIILIAGIPLALGSWWGLTFLLVTIPSLAWRILDEEKLLKKNLPDYSEYMKEVHFRLLPYIW